MENEIFDIAVIGAGPAGVMACHAIKKQNKNLKILLIEKENRSLRKFKITGKGRCNLTNNVSPHLFLENLGKKSKFLYSSFSKFNNSDTIEFFESIGVKTKNERGNRVFPQSDSAFETAISFYDTLVKGYSIRSLTNTKITDIKHDGNSFILFDGKLEHRVKKLIISTGGITYPLTGSDGSIFPAIKKLGHKIVSLRHALCGMKIHDDDLKVLQGISLRNVYISFLKGEKKLYGDMGELLFTEHGVTGPIVLKTSRSLRENFTDEGDIIGDCKISIDLKPGIDEKKLDAKLVRILEKDATKNIGNIFKSLGPGKLIDKIIERCCIDPEIKASELPKQLRKRFLFMMKNFRVNISSLDGIESSVITMGGVKLSEVDSKTMESKKIPGLYFAGEVLDLDGPTGGYNLQISFTTGFAAGMAVSDSFEISE